MVKLYTVKEFLKGRLDTWVVENPPVVIHQVLFIFGFYFFCLTSLSPYCIIVAKSSFYNWK